MSFINYSVLGNISEKEFQNTKPFPWINPEGALTKEAFSKLEAALPDVALFEKSVGLKRAHGQKPHDRYELKYTKGVAVDPVWEEFIEEIFSPQYQNEIARIFGIKNFTTRCQWQYAYEGCSVSPHCDSPNKLGSQIFYMNTPKNWKEEWGGRTLVLDDGGKFSCDSAPDLSEFEIAGASIIIPNRSFIFGRNNHSWHAVEELVCPEGAYRKLFTVVFNRKPSFFQRFKNKLRALFNGEQ